MDVRLSAEQHALHDAARSLADRLAPTSVRDLDDAERRGRLDAALHSSGWRELRAADGDGAPWSSVVEPALVAEELGRALTDTAFVGPTLAAELRRCASASIPVEPETVAMTEDFSGLAVVADPDGCDAVAFDAAGAASAVVLLCDGDGDGYRLGEVPVSAADGGADLTRRQAHVTGRVTPVDGASILTRDHVASASACGLALTCADLVGVMSGAIRLGCAHVTTRHQYGAPVGSFQAVQHLLADAQVAMEGSRSVARHAAWAVDALDPQAALTAASVAKAYCARSARDVCEAVIQVHGGIGNTWECLAHVYLRRALVSTDAFGGVGPSLERVLDQRLAVAGASVAG
jgi:alkylation response protein AidB-like acyl-CoA dehydrogenase